MALDIDEKRRDVIHTGIPGLDEVLAGGLPRDHMYLIEGSPGSGKTTLALQFLLDGARLGESCLYVTFSETQRELRAVAESHGWSLDGIVVLELVPLEADLGRQQSIIHPSEFDLGETIGLVLQKVSELRPDRLVIDALTELRLLAQDPLGYRRQVLALKQFFAQRRTTVLALDDLTDAHGQQLHSVVHGVISHELRRMEYGTVRRRLIVSKLRGVNFRSGYHDYVIRTGGITVFPNLEAAAHVSTFPPGVVLSGMSELDSLLGGGLRTGTSTLLVGPSGAGKSSLALRYATAAPQPGETASVFAFDENYRTASDRALGLGMDLGAAIEGGRLRWEQINPATLSPGEFVAIVQRHVEVHRARIVVIDSLNSYLNSMPGEQALALHMHELLAYLGNKGVATILVMAQHGLVGDVQAPLDLSFLADTIVLLRYFEAEGAVRKAISVLKSRSSRHETTIREYRLGPGTIGVGPPIREFQGVLSGIPTYVGPTDARRHGR